MQRHWAVVGVTVWGLLAAGGASWLAAAEPGRKLVIPEAAARAKVEALIQELFADELSQVKKDPLVQGRLALLFLQEGRDTADEPAGRFVLFAKARDLAARAGDAATALQAIDELTQHFTIPAVAAFRMKVQSLGTASGAVVSPAAGRAVVDAALVLLEEALGLDDYEAGLQLVATAELAARKLRIVSLVVGIRKRQQEVQAQQKEYARWKPFADRLAANPQDAEANGHMGKYQAFLRGNWDKGLVLLAAGNDPLLKKLAALDLAEPKGGQQQVELAGKWLQVANGLKGPMAEEVLLRSYHRYVQALSELDAAGRNQVDQRMRAILERLPAGHRLGDIAAEAKRIEGHPGPVYTVALSPDGRRAVAGGADGSVRLYDVKTGKEMRRCDGHAGRVWTVAFAPDGRRFASGGFDKTIRLWDPVSGREIRRFPGHDDYVRSLAFTPDGRYILSGGDDRLLRLWDVDTGKEASSFPGHDHFVWSVAIARDGKRALSASLDRTVRLWDLVKGQELKRLVGHDDTVVAVAFSPDGRQALSGSTDKTLKLWDLYSGKELATFTGHKGYVNSVSFSPDGRRALSAGQDGMIFLWDVPAAKELRRLEAHPQGAWSVVFARDGRSALSGGQDNLLRLWGGPR